MPAQPTKDKAIGVIVYFEFPRSTKYLIVKHKKGHWSFAKGHKEKDESSIQTARRELFEEAGIKEVELSWILEVILLQNPGPARSGLTTKKS